MIIVMVPREITIAHIIDIYECQCTFIAGSNDNISVQIAVWKDITESLVY